MRVITTCLCIFVFAHNLSAQDSAFYNLGRVQLRKNFSQSISIKGRDLERVSATSLHEAIDIWLYGSLSNINTLVYVVDGYIATDVNVYDIRQIEEVTLIQNAAVQANGAFRQQQMVLIQTKRSKTQGWKVQASGFSAMITRKMFYPATDKTVNGDNSLFHDYLVSVTRKEGTVNAGVSAGFLRDASVMIDSTITEQEPNSLQRYRVNTYLNWTINKHHELSTKINMAKQPNNLYLVQRQLWTNGSSKFHRNGKDKAINAEITLNSKWKNGLANSLGTAYSGLAYNDSTQFVIDDPSNPVLFSQGRNKEKTKNFLLTNTFRWTVQKRDLSLSPALNISYRYLKENIEFSSTSAQQVYYLEQKNKGEKWLLTPSFDFLYRQSVNVQAGVVADLSRLHTHRWYPYLSLSANVNELTGMGSLVKCQLFGSYATAGYFLDHVYWLRQFAIDGSTEMIYNNPYANPINYYPSPDSNFYNWQVGTTLSLFNSHLKLSYNFEKRDYIGTTAITTVFGQAVIYPETKSGTHDIRAELNIVQGSKLSWFSGIHFTSIKNKVSLPFTMNAWDPIYFQMGDVNDQKRSWSSGWNNRVQFKNLFFGLDVLYYFSKFKWINRTPYNAASDKFNLLSMRSVYLAYRLSMQKNNELELYVLLRNPYQNKDYMQFLDTRAYSGVGITLTL